MLDKVRNALKVLVGSKQAISSADVWPPIRVQTVVKVIEVKAPRIAQSWTKEIKDAVGTLPAHPGFNALMDRFALHKQMLEHKCATEFHKDLREGDYLQAGVFWLGYAQRLVDEATQSPRTIPVDAYEEEMEAFNKINEQIERIGMEPSQRA